MPAGIAAFHVKFPVQEGNRSHVPICAELEYDTRAPRMGEAWPVSVATGTRGTLRPTSSPAANAPPPSQYDPALPSPLAGRVRLPQFESAEMGGTTGVRPQRVGAAPPPCGRWMPAADAEAAERIVEPSLAEVFPCAIAQRTPGAASLTLPETYLRQGAGLASTPQAEPVLVDAAPVMDSRPALRQAAPALLRFAIHAVEEFASAPASMFIPEPAPALAVSAPGVADWMPAAAVFVPAAIAPAPALRLLEIGSLAARPMPLARAISALGRPLSPTPVESMPAVAQAIAQPVAFRVALRRPTLAHLHPAQESAEEWAAPVAAPGPMAVESFPAAQAFSAKPTVARPVLVQMPLRAPLRPAAMVLGGFDESRAPAAVQPEPRWPAHNKPRLEPVARIAAQPDGAQPVRPKPEIPHPGLFPLEYYCQRIASAPVKQLTWMDAPVALRRPPFQVSAALRPFAEYGIKPRKLLPFEEFFTGRRRNGERVRVKIGYAGKIAATIMVGIALWAGSRLANLSDHAEAFRAQVAQSERAVTAVAEVRRAKMGNGPIARVRRAIADRAATQVTETFATGMEAWGANSKAWAPGWQHSPDGYVRTGEMALFRPSLNYSDYRMEFYGQIENKSMSWVVRAKDKQNYYAMKFTVIEPGLRPIIAMVHYQVANGKRGHSVETPLSVMVHNNQPYHVSVDVRGNHFAAAIEGEPVESWTDDTLAQGGIGFFSEAGERARLYWMRISRNQDWLGRFCAYLSGDSNGGQQTAEWWGPEIPRRAPEPVVPRTPEVALVQAGAGLEGMNGPNRAKALKYRRAYTWIS